MSKPLQTYLSAIRKKRATGVTHEHAYRPPPGSVKTKDVGEQLANMAQINQRKCYGRSFYNLSLINYFDLNRPVGGKLHAKVYLGRDHGQEV